MINRIYNAKILFLLFLYTTTGTAIAAPDGLLEHVRQTHRTHGKKPIEDAARGYGWLLRKERGETLFPVIVDRSITERPNFKGKLASAGARVDASSKSYSRLLVPLSRMDQLISAFPDDALRAPTPVQPAFGFGPRVSQSVNLSGADGYQASTTLDGSGIRVAVVDLGFSGLTAAINQGELPAGTCDGSHSVDFTGTSLQSTTVHGTGVAEHLVDMAPGVELYCLKVSDLMDMQLAAAYLAANNIRIANHSVAWALQSYYDDTGPINQVINESHDTDGVFWTVASGNSAQRHWRGSWLDADGDNTLEFVAGDETLGLTGSGSPVTILLNWNQYGFANKTNLNLYVLNAAGSTVASSTLSQSPPANYDPWEAVSFNYQSGAAPYSIRVTRAGGASASGLDITLFSFNHNFEHKVAAASLMDPADAHGAFTIGAVDQAVWLQANPPTEAYSSQGPTTDGRLKPELVAPDGTLSYTYPVATGTSFSAPTTAGAAALLLQENLMLNTTGLRNLLIAEAIDVGAAGSDNVYGAGKLQMPAIDSDDDGLSNVEELQLGTDVLDSDTDNDGLSDFEEDRTYGTSPLFADSDLDGVDDYAEVVTYGTDPLVSNRGDVNLDGAFNLGDYLVLSRLASGVLVPNAAQSAVGDLNNNALLDAGDLVLMMRVLQGYIAMPL